MSTNVNQVAGFMLRTVVYSIADARVPSVSEVPSAILRHHCSLNDLDGEVSVWARIYHLLLCVFLVQQCSFFCIQLRCYSVHARCISGGALQEAVDSMDSAVCCLIGLFLPVYREVAVCGDTALRRNLLWLASLAVGANLWLMVRSFAAWPRTLA